MRFKQLEISGFKSFAGKTIFEFREGITAIVGPNGTGKSNIVDAILWSLGARGKKSMRSQKSEELIFHGSDRRKSVGMAAVNLVLEDVANESGMRLSSLALSRSVFRSGENQYFINSRPVRLIDIEEMSAKAKIGSDMVIKQGEADFLVNASPEERLTKLKSASGVKALQIKSDESEKRLNKAKTNLEETVRLIKEISPHFDFLEKQKKKFEEKTLLDNRLNSLKQSYYALLWRKIQEKRKNLLKKQQDVLTKIGLKEKEKINKENQLREVENQIFDRERKTNDSLELKKAEEKRSFLFRELGEAEARLRILKDFLVSESGSGGNFEPIMINPFSLDKMANEIMAWFDNSSNVYSGRHSIEILKSKISELFSLLGILTDKKEAVKKRKSIQAEADLLNKKRLEILSAIKNIDGKIKSIVQKDTEDELSVLRVNFHKFSESLRDILVELQKLKSEQVEIIREGEGIKLSEKRIEEDVRQFVDFFDNLEETLKSAAEENINILENDIRKIESRIFSAGAVDESVLQEYESVKKRFDFLTKSKDDLEKSIVNIEKSIMELKGKIKNDLKRYFEAVNREFNRYFDLLFKGGQASLEIADNNGVEGLEIKISLPRKKIKRLELLSGGEKSLVSLAFLFSMIVVLPPPFLILDEVDAALDEINAHRFMQILRDLTPRTQFVIITHNRESMKLADVLYGISMRDGASSVFSLNLS